MRSASSTNSARRSFDIIEHTSARLEEVEGIGKKRRQEIRESWMKQKSVHEIMVFLHERGISTARALRIHKTYGEDAITVLQAEPVSSRRGHSRRRVQDGRRDRGEHGHRPGRAPAGARRAASTRWRRPRRRGTAACPPRCCCEEAEKILGVGAALIDAQLAEMLADETLTQERVAGEVMIYLPELLGAEQSIAERLRELLELPAAYPAMDIEKAIAWCETKTGKQLAESQRRAVREALRQRVLIITGGPGVGKTTIVNSILTILRAKKVRVKLAAPTGRAAQRLGESTGLEAVTLHRLLESQGEGAWGRSRSKRLEGDLFVVDEVSMVDAPLMARLLDALPDEAHLLLVGDADQLPSVGPGAVLHDLIAGRERALRAVDGGFPSGRAEPHHHRCARHQSRRDARSAGGARTRISSSSSAAAPEEIQQTIVQLVRDRLPARVWFRSRDRHPGALSDEPAIARHPGLQRSCSRKRSIRRTN